ncbi:MAG: hypothetical protein V1494_06825 [Candidatus Diapherotrites archaeon]
MWVKRRLSSRFIKKIASSPEGVKVGRITYRQFPGSGLVAFRAESMHPKHPEKGMAVRRIYTKEGKAIKEEKRG